MSSIDPAYEFDCPRYRDFDQAEDDSADTWFTAGGGKLSDINEVLAEPTTEVTVNHSTLTVPIQGLQLSQEANTSAVIMEEEMKEVEQEVVTAEPTSAVAEEMNDSVGATVAAMEIDSNEVTEPVASAEEPVTAAVEEQVVMQEVVTVSEPVTLDEVVPMVEEEKIEITVETSASVSPLIEPTSAPSNNMLGASALLEDVLIPQSINLSASQLLGATMEFGTRGSLVFTDAHKRSSLPVLENNPSADVHVEQAQMSLFDAPIDAAIVESDSMDHEQETPAKPSIMEQFALVADEHPVNVDDALPLVSAPNTQRKVISRPSTATYLQPTAAALAKMTTHAKITSEIQAVATAGAKVAPPSTGRVQITSRRRGPSMAPQAAAPHHAAPTSSAAPTSTVATPQTSAITPRQPKRRGVNQAAIDALARPKTAKKPEDAPSTAGSKRKQAPSESNTPHRPTHAAPKLTIAQSPALSTRARAKIHTHAPMLTTEEAEILKVQQEKEALEKMTKLHHKQYQQQHDAAVAGSHSDMPVRGGQLTQPEEFTFQTAKRAKFTAPTHALAADANAPVVRDLSAKVQAIKADPLDVTKPQPFSFQTSSRTRPAKPAPISKEELEFQEMLAHKPFKARPFNKEIFESCGEQGVPRVVKQKLTEATSPNFATKERSLKRKQEEESKAAANGEKEQPKSAKKARSVGPFHFATEERAAMHHKEEEPVVEAKPHTARASHHPQLTVPMTPKVLHHSMEQKARIEAEIAEKIQAEKDLANFKARPCPVHESQSSTHSTEIHRNTRPLTAPMTPKFATDYRVEKRAEWDAQLAQLAAEKAAQDEELRLQREQQIKEETKEYRKTLVLRAAPLPVKILEQVTFVPKPSQAKLTQPESPLLRTKQRALTQNNIRAELNSNEVIKPLSQVQEETNSQVEAANMDVENIENIAPTNHTAIDITITQL